MTSSYWFQGGEAPTPDLGFPINNSLRLRENGYLERTTSEAGDSETFTFSAWIKSDGTGGTYLACAPIGSICEHLPHNAGGDSGFWRWTNVNIAATCDTLGKFRDSSGWYHVVQVRDNGVLKTYVNGVQAENNGNNLVAYNVNDAGTTVYIGANRVGSAIGAGLIAEANFIDGQALEPTAFGRYNDEGIWVPIEIDFSMNGPEYSEYLTAPGGWQSGYGPDKAFNGQVAGTNNMAISSVGNDTVTFAPPTPIPFTSEIAIFSSQTDNTASWDGNDWSLAATNDWEAFSGSGEISIEKPLTITSAGNGVTVDAIRIDGEILTDPFLYSADVFTTPDSARDWNSTDLNIVSNNYPVNGFDGDQNTDTETASGSTIFWRPATPFTKVTKVEIFAGAGCDVYLNQVNTVQGVSATRTTIYDGGPITLESLGVSASARPRFSAIWINDQLLIDGQNSSYGVNGFRLDFSDPNDIGADRSGNGNHFTASGINLAYPGLFSTNVTTNVSWNDQNVPYADGESDYIWYGGCSSETCSDIDYVFEPANGIALNGRTLRLGTGGTSYYQTKYRFTFSDASVVTLDWQASASNQTTFQNVKTGDVSLTKFEMFYDGAYVNANNHGGWTGLWLDDAKLVDTGGINYDHFQDSPTNNWCTLNPERVWKEGGPTVTEGALKVGSLTPVDKISVQGTQSVTSGKWYYEVTNDDGQTININAGWARTSYEGLFNTDEDGVYTHTITQDKTMMVALDLDNGFMWFGFDGVWDNGATLAEIESGDGTNSEHNGVSGDLAPCFIDQATSYSGFGYFNFGQKPFLYQVPTGFKSLNTQNKPKTTVNGSDHFRVLTGPGSSILAIAQGNLNGNNGSGFQRGLWWIKDLENNSNNQLVDVVRGSSRQILSPDINAEIPWTPPAGESVAWCWKAGDTIETNNVGSIETQVSANVEGGFSIVSYSGTGAAGATIGHGLGKKPDLVIIRNRNDSGNSYRVWNPYIADGSNYSLYLDMTAPLTLDSDSVQAADDSTITLATDALGTNKSGHDYICYAWTNVPGYSSIGTYTGNGDVDGPCIRTDFTPAFVMVKRMNGTANWQILDAGRTLYNPAKKWLEANTATPEQTGNSFIEEDFNCNGFKPRGGASTQDNLNNEVYLYVAFATEPFAGKNKPPATAAFIGPVQYDGLVPGISSSLRFRGAQLSRSGMGTDSIYTISYWIKKALQGTSQTVFQSSFKNVAISFNSNDQWDYQQANTRGVTTSVYRDPSSWYHVVYNYTNASGQDNGYLYINGQEVDPDFTNGGNTWGGDITIGESGGTQDFYLADVYYIPGQDLPPTEFGEYSDDGVWVPKEQPNLNAADYGENGYHLVFDPAYVREDTLLDQSGNGNDFTMSGFEIGDFYSADFDFMKDGPGFNYATYNPLAIPPSGVVDRSTNHAFINGNMGFQANTTVGTAEYRMWCAEGTQGGIRSGKWYFETTKSTPNGTHDITPNNSWAAGWATSILPTSPPNYNGDDTWSGLDNYAVFDGWNGWKKDTGNTVQPPQNTPTEDFNQVLSYSVDFDSTTDNVKLYWNGEVVNTMSWDSQGKEYWPVFFGAYDYVLNVNFGQQPFRYPLPGYQPLSSRNLPEAPITNGRDHFTSVVFPYTQQTISGLDFAPGLVWLKVRNNTWNHRLYDTSRGALQRLEPNNNGTENGGGTDNDGLNSFTSDGFTHLGLGASGSDEYVAWCWKAGGTPVVNNDGNIESQVSVNNTAGFSIVTYTGTGSIATLGHGLDNEPDFIIFKNRDAEENWACYHRSMGPSGILALNGNFDFHVNNAYFTNSNPDANNIALGNSPMTNGSGNEMVAYCWNSVPGYSAFGTFEGSGNADGAFVHCGFRPAFILTKDADVGGTNWIIKDTARVTSNPDQTRLQPNESEAETTGPFDIDFLSNGFKVRDNSGDINQGTIVYIAFAENPFNISNAR